MKAVIDTNVLLVANNKHANVSPECVERCVQRLLDIQQNGVTVIDDQRHILEEYLHETSPNEPKGVGDSFLKFLLRNAFNTDHVEQVSITEIGPNEFAEFPDHSLQPLFDSSDRKFPAVSNAHPDKPPIWQTVDSKWLNWSPALQAKGVKVHFICPDDIARFFKTKFPNLPEPSFPEV
jgi:hypothetical protein